MPDGSSSAAPVMKPGPSVRNARRRPPSCASDRVACVIAMHPRERRRRDQPPINPSECGKVPVWRKSASWNLTGRTSVQWACAITRQRRLPMSTLIAEEVAIAPAGAFVSDNDARSSPISWSAIAAGAVASAGFSLFLLHLGIGLGLSAVSPWSGPSSTTMSIATGISVCLLAVLAGALGGYITGRLRTSPVGLHTDETYFRDTAHGFVTWAFATIISAAVIASVASSVVGSTAQGVASNPNATDAY